MKMLKNSTNIKLWDEFILTGDLDALSTIYFEYYDFLFDYGMRLTNDKHAVEDAIQSEFISIINSRKNISPVKNLPGYLVSSFRRQLFHDLNRQHKIVLSELSAEGQFEYFKSTDQNRSESESREQIYAIVKQCISQLTPKQQEIIFLRFERELSYEEISDMLNISVESCYKSTYRAIKTIKAEAERILKKNGDIFFFFFFKDRKNLSSR